MNCYQLPAYIVLEIPSPITETIQSMRDSLATPAARLPVELTVAGSSGIGPIPAGTDKNETEAVLKTMLASLRPFRAGFHAIRRFPNTNIFYLAPEDRQPFDQIHGMLKNSRILFSPSPWPYNPHCTLRGGPMKDHASAEDIFRLSFPKDEFVIDTLSIYEFDPQNVKCHLSFQTRI